MKTILQNGVYFQPKDYELKPVSLLCEGDTILQIQDHPILPAGGEQVYDLGGRLVVPGFVDGHTHLAQSFGRGIYDNLHLTDWLVARSWDRPLNESEVYTASMLGAVEALRSGTTTVAEMTTVGDLGEVVFQALTDSGLRAVASIPMSDFREGAKRPPTKTASEWLQTIENLYKNWHGTADGRMSVRISPAGLPACSEDLMCGTRALADQLGIGIHTHCCEGQAETANSYERFGISEVEVLARCGVLGTDTQLAHCIWLTDRDKQLIAETGSNVITCPSTNTKITDGMPPMPELAQLGVNIAIGCDGAASSGSFDMLQEARLASLLGKISSDDAAMFPAERIYEMMTLNGAAALGLGQHVGALEIGYKADMTVINYPRVHLIDERRLLSNLIYSASGKDVYAVFVGARALIWAGACTHLDEEALIQRALELMRAGNNSLGIHVHPV